MHKKKKVRFLMFFDKEPSNSPVLSVQRWGIQVQEGTFISIMKQVLSAKNFSNYAPNGDEFPRSNNEKDLLFDSIDTDRIGYFKNRPKGTGILLVSDA
jgi:hypothetical protein